MTSCPLCGGNSIGKVGNHQFYCRDCYVEFSVQKNGIAVYEVGDDGSLIPYGLRDGNAGVVTEKNK